MKRSKPTCCERPPLTAQQAERSIDALLAVRGKAVADAYLAALLKQNGVTRLTPRIAIFVASIS